LSFLPGRDRPPLQLGDLVTLADITPDGARDWPRVGRVRAGILLLSAALHVVRLLPYRRTVYDWVRGSKLSDYDFRS
jgi:hypothetical protein